MATTEALGRPLRFERRRYGTTTYTWVEVEVDGKWHDLGDPWPCITPRLSEIEEGVRRVLEGEL